MSLFLCQVSVTFRQVQIKFGQTDDRERELINPNYSYRRFNYRTNLDFDVTDNFNMRLDVSSRFMDINEPYNMNVTGELYDFSKMHPYSAPLLNPDGSFAYLYDTQDRKPTLNARLANEGYKRTRRNDNNILYGATWKMDFLTPGLAADFQLIVSATYIQSSIMPKAREYLGSPILSPSMLSCPHNPVLLS